MRKKATLFSILLLTALLANAAAGCRALSSAATPASLVINEIVSSNKNSLVDHALGSPDWIELYNASDKPVLLTGCALSDNARDLHKFVFPELAIGPGEFLIVYASGNDGATRTDVPCTGFGLSKSGDFLFFTDAYYGLLAELELPALFTDVSYARRDDGTYGYCALPTPGSANTEPIGDDIEQLFAERDSNRPVITEVMPFADETGAPWVELYNGGTTAIRLDQYYLSDSPQNVMRDQLPRASLGAGAYVCIRLDGLGRGEGDAGGIHAGFRLGSGDTCVLLADMQGNVVSELDWQAGLPKGIAVVRTEQGPMYTAFATFEAANSDAVFADPTIRRMDASDPVRINEVLPHNTQSAVDGDGDRGEWVELANRTASPVLMHGYFLSDDAEKLYKWALPDVTIPAHGYLLVFLSGKDRTQGELHASFRLGGEESELYLTTVDGMRCDVMAFGGIARNDVSVGLDAQGQIRYFAYPTPERANAQGYETADEVGFFSPDGVFISEVCSANAPKSGENDWIELHNGGDEAVDVTGWYLSDNPDEPEKWRIDSRTIRAKGYIYIEATSHTARQKEGVATFGIRTGGETLLLSDAEGRPVDRFRTGTLGNGLTSGRVERNAGIERVFFTIPTRGKENAAPAADGYAPTPSLSETGLYHSAPFTVTITAREHDAAIYYTTDGSVPTRGDTRYEGEITITGNTVLRAVSVREGKLVSPPATATYLFEAPHTVPVVCINGNPDEVRAVLRVKSQTNKIEREAFISYYETDGTLATAFPAGIRPKGASTIVNAQKSLTMHLRAGYGQSEVTYPFFDEYAFSTFSTLTVRNCGQDWQYAHLRDAFCQRIVEGMQIDNVATRPVVVYINGAYYGLYDLCEDQNEDFLKTHYGVDPDHANIVKRNETPVAGSEWDFVNLREYALQARLSSDEEFAKFAERIDVPYFTDYFIAETYVINSDFFNQKYWRTTDGTLKWRPIYFDLDYGWRNKPSHDILSQYFNENGVPSANGSLTYVEVYIGLQKNKAWRDYAVKRYVECVLTYFNSDRAVALLDEMAAAIRAEMPRQIARWRKPDSMDAWEREIELMRRFALERPDYALKNLRRYFDVSETELNALIAEYSAH